MANPTGQHLDTMEHRGRCSTFGSGNHREKTSKRLLTQRVPVVENSSIWIFASEVVFLVALVFVLSKLALRCLRAFLSHVYGECDREGYFLELQN